MSLAEHHHGHGADHEGRHGHDGHGHAHGQEGIHGEDRAPAGGHGHRHYHAPEDKKRQLNRIARAIGHLQHVKGMIERDEDCAAVLIQLSAVRSAITSLGREITNEHIGHCIAHAIEEGDTESIREFQRAIEKFFR